MTKNNIVPVYNGVEIRFDGELVNLTSMWKACGGNKDQQPYEWLRHDDTKRFIKAAESKTGLEPVLSKKGRYGGTFAHWQIAMAYAKYLSPEFHIWCNEVVKERFKSLVDIIDLTISKSKTSPTHKRSDYGKYVGLFDCHSAIYPHCHCRHRMAG